MSDKKQVLFVLNSMPCGGVEKSLLSYLSLLSPDRHEVTLLLVEATGDLLGEVPAWVQVVEMPFPPRELRLKELGRKRMIVHSLLHGRIDWALNVLVRWFKWRWLESDLSAETAFFLGAVRSCRRRFPRGFRFAYDLAVAYGCYYRSGCIVRELFTGRETAAWFHSEDQSRWEGVGYYRRIYSWFDHRYTCSASLAVAHNRFYAHGEEKFVWFPHYLNRERYLELAEAEEITGDGFEGFRILTVGRVSPQKGFDIAIRVCKLLVDAHCPVRWYAVGDGEMMDECRSMVKDLDLEDRFILVGMKSNPYPYFKACDVYVQPSRFEGYCLTVAEARCFAKPIVCTNFTGAHDQLKNGVSGSIVDGHDEHDLYVAIKELLDNTALRKSYSEYLKRELVGNHAVVQAKWRELLHE